MSIPYPWEVDWAYVATDIVMPAFVWLHVVAIVFILFGVAVKSARRAQEQWLRETSATEAPHTAETSEAISGPKDG